jgi:NAD+ kinase
MRFAIIGNTDKPGLREAVSMLIDRLERSKADYVIDRSIVALLGVQATERVREREFEGVTSMAQAEMVIAFGGDGTMLGVAREVGERATPILGVNLGKLGFLAELAPEEMEEAIQDVLAGEYVVEDRLVLEAMIPGPSGKKFFALNDVVIDRSRTPRIIDLETHINGQFAVTYRGDGMIVSTPTGSTAYALSNGGPIVTPTCGVIGITPISPHTLSGRPLIVPDQSQIRVIVRTSGDEVLFSADGQVEAVLRPPAEIVIRKATHPVRLVKRHGRSYFDVLRAKLLWGQDVRSSNR